MVSRVPGDTPLSPRTGPELRFLEGLRSRVAPREFESWFGAIDCRFLPPRTFILGVLNAFQGSWLRRHYLAVLTDSARSALDGDAAVEFEVLTPSAAAAASPAATPSHAAPRAGLTSVAPGDSAPSAFRGSAASLGLPPASPRPFQDRVATGNRPTAAPATESFPEHTFESFVVGSSNRVAHAAAMTISDYPGKTYNPLFLHGQPGVGKTHLLHAIERRVGERTLLRARYMTALDFVDRFTLSAERFTLEAFRSELRDVDVLLIDDLQFLPAKEKTQLELLRVFNALMEDRKQIVLASRTHPRDIPGFEERLTSRFQAGLVSSLEPPDLDTRTSILIRCALRRGVDIPAELAEAIASRIPESVRELEGAIIRVLSLASFHQVPPSMETVRAALPELFETARRPTSTTVPDILRAVQDHYGIRPKDLLSRSKARSLVLARQVAMFLSRELTPLSLEEIGVHFGGRDHTTVLYSTGRIARLRGTDPKIQSDVETLRRRLRLDRVD